MSIDKKQISKEMIMKAMQCNDAEELVVLAKSSGMEMTKEEAEAYMEEMDDFELDEAQLKQVAGGIKACYMIDGCASKCGTLKSC